MRDLKIRPGMDTPKAKLKNPTPKDAESILKKHMDKRQKEKEPESRDPVRYATDRVEKNMRRGASGAADASRRMIKHYRGKLRQSKENAVGGHSAADMGIGSENVFIDTPMEYAFSPVQTTARNEVGNRTISPQNCGGPKSADAAPQERGRQKAAQDAKAAYRRKLEKRMPNGDATIAATRITVRSSTSTTVPPPAATMELAADAIPLPIVCTACTIAPPIFFAPLPPFFADVWSIVCCALRCAAALARRVMIALFGVAWSVGRTRMVRVTLVMTCPLLGPGPPLTDAP